MFNEVNAVSSPSSAVPAAARSRRPDRAVRRWVGVLVAVAALSTLSACGTRVVLSDVPVEDRGATAVAPLPQAGVGAGGAAGAGVDQRGVSAVEVATAQADQPAAMERVLYFDFDSFVVRPEFTPVLEANAQFLNADRNRRVVLEGHTDEQGGREYNLALGQRRAEAVRQALSLLGVREAQMEAVSFGEEKPVVVGFDEAAFAKNRRVELIYR